MITEKVKHINQLGELLADLQHAYERGEITGIVGIVRHKDGAYVTFWIDVPFMEGTGMLEIIKINAVLERRLEGE